MLGLLAELSLHARHLEPPTLTCSNLIEELHAQVAAAMHLHGGRHMLR